MATAFSPRCRCSSIDDNMPLQRPAYAKKVANGGYVCYVMTIEQRAASFTWQITNEIRARDGARAEHRSPLMRLNKG